MPLLYLAPACCVTLGLKPLLSYTCYSNELVEKLRRPFLLRTSKPVAHLLMHPTHSSIIVHPSIPMISSGIAPSPTMSYYPMSPSLSACAIDHDTSSFYPPSYRDSWLVSAASILVSCCTSATALFTKLKCIYVLWYENMFRLLLFYSWTCLRLGENNTPHRELVKFHLHKLHQEATPMGD